MSGFWDKQTNSQQPTQNNGLSPYQQPIVLDEQAMAEFQENPSIDLFDEEEEDTASVMLDVNLRLEMGRLYQMVMQGDIFSDTNADPKAIRNVQRQIRKFVRKEMELMLGIRQEQTSQQPVVVSSPFNDMEVTVLKMLASKMSKGQTESQEPAAPAVPKKDGITSISGNVKPVSFTTPLSSGPVKKAAAPKPQNKQGPKSALVKEDTSLLTKPIDEMTPEELLAHNKAAEERSKQKYAAMPNNLIPHPNPQQLEMLYTQSAANMTIANPWRANS